MLMFFVISLFWFLFAYKLNKFVKYYKPMSLMAVLFS